jgi:hypothetical protein
MTPEYILRKSLCRKPLCADRKGWQQTAQSYIENLNYASEYAEPGYDSPRKGILFSNWNYFPSKVADILEKYGYSIGWEDEWSTCDGCGRAVRTSPDSYGWQPSCVMNDGGTRCIDCLDEIYIESLENQPTRAVNLHRFDPAAFGYTKLEGDFESGWHPGQNDKPAEIYARLHPTHARLLFVVDDVGQFDMRFSIWEKAGALTD